MEIRGGSTGDLGESLIGSPTNLPPCISEGESSVSESRLHPTFFHLFEDGNYC